MSIATPTKDVKLTPEEEAQLKWVKFREDTLGEYAFVEHGKSPNYLQRFKDNPFVPIGALATVCALGYGLICFKRGDQKKSQLMMRSRVAAQGFTVFALITGFILNAVTKTKVKNN